MKIISYSDQGPRRTSNQDNFWAASIEVSGSEGLLAAVCDGMGGLDRGGEASRITCENIREVALQSVDVESIKKAIHNSNSTLFNLGVQHEKRMGTTCTFLKVHQGQFTVLHIGDTRCYRIHSTGYSVLTEDHTAFEKFKREGREVIAAAENKLRSQLTRCLGVQRIITVDESTGAAAPGDRFLLASDGFWHLLTEQDLREIYADPMEDNSVLRRLVHKFIAISETDNLTAVLVEV